MMKKFLVFLFGFLLVLGTSLSASAGLLGTYYNLDMSHPDMEVWSGGPGMVESNLTGPTPTLTALGSATYNQFDWWDSQYYAFERVDSDADLQGNFSSSWFPVDEDLDGSLHYFAVHWEGQFYVDENQFYEYTMGSDDDAWLFIDDELILDLGGVHAMTWDSYTVPLTQGYHDIDIFFAERHTVESGFQLNFFSDLEPGPAVPEPATLLLLGSGLIGIAGISRKKFKK